jgi:hypothetical protein
MPFEIVGEITQIETIAVGGRIRDVARLQRLYGRGTGMKRTGSAGKRSSASDMSTKRPRIRRQPTPRFVVCINNADYPASLELHKIYRVVADTAAARDGDLRIVDESGEDYLYPAEWFAAVELPQRVKSSLRKRSPRLLSNREHG